MTINFDWFILLTVCLVTLKLVNLINWSWWLVFLPIWILPAVIFAGLMLLFLVFVLMTLIGWTVEVLK